MANLGFYFDATRCHGCRTCQIACKDKNRLDVGTLFRNVKSYSVGTYPNVKVFHFSASCNHCTNPACVAGCPTKAMYVAEDGTVLHDDALCIGCGNCVNTCPYGVPTLTDKVNEAGYTVAGKCDGCYAIRQAGGQPACVASCLARALDFGDLDELKAKYGADLVSAIPVCPDGGTGAHLLIKTKEAALSADAKEMVI